MTMYDRRCTRCRRWYEADPEPRSLFYYLIPTATGATVLVCGPCFRARLGGAW